MERLEKQFMGKGEVAGIEFTEIKRSDVNPLIRIYKRSDFCFEVITIKEQEEHSTVIKGVDVNYKAKEIYPKGEGWNGYCVKDLSRAEKYFESMVKEYLEG